jgi:hypothetical protein
MKNLGIVTKLNLIAQGRIGEPEGKHWFSGMDHAGRKEVIDTSILMLLQAKLMEGDAQAAISRAGMRPSLPQCAVLVRGDLRWADRLASVGKASVNERERAFSLLLSLFWIADGRRRSTRCANGCSHWWHHIPAEDA